MSDISELCIATVAGILTHMKRDCTESPCPVTLPPAPAGFDIDGGGVSLLAPAKINLNLLVAPLGGDGFHPVDSLVAKITLYDSLEIRPRTDGRIVLNCRAADCGRPENNLVTRAGELLAAGRDVCGADIKLTKAIPPGAGLGGGSSDAAAALRGLNEIWRLGHDVQALADIGAQLGSDIPLFLGPPAARITGRGQRVEPLKVAKFTAVLVMCGLVCSTPEVYAAFDRLGVEASEQLDVEMLASNRPSQWRRALRNDLAAAAMDVCPELSLLHARLDKSVDAPVHVTGSGSAMFILCDDAAEASQMVSKLDADLQKMCVIVSGNPW